MTVFGLETPDIAFLGLLFSVVGAIVTPITIFLIRIGRNVSSLMEYVERHEPKADKESEILERLNTDMAVTKTRVRALESKVFKRNGAIGEVDE